VARAVFFVEDISKVKKNKDPSRLLVLKKNKDPANLNLTHRRKLKNKPDTVKRLFQGIAYNYIRATCSNRMCDNI
jgi:hypothetical protein